MCAYLLIAGAMGYMVNIDENGDAEGNYSLIGRKLKSNTTNKYGIYPIGVFLMPDNTSQLPVNNSIL